MVTTVLCSCGMKKPFFTLRGIGYYSPIEMQEESYSTALLEEMVITLLCGCERKTTLLYPQHVTECQGTSANIHKAFQKVN